MIPLNVQPLFHHLLRNDVMSEQDLLEFGWEDFNERYSEAKGEVTKEAIFDMTRGHLDHLRNVGILEKTSDRYSTHESHHPNLSPSLDKILYNSQL